MIISLNRRYVFVHIHKCAGTSIEIALAKSLRHNDLVFGSTKSGEKHQDFFRRAIGLNKHSTAREARGFLGDEYWTRSFKFAFVRHPVDRLRSLFHYAHKLAEGTPMTEEELHAFNNEGRLPDKAPYRYKAVRAAMKSGSFSEFAMHPLTWQDSGAQPQWESVCDDAGELIVDFIGKVETIEQDWAILTKRLEVDAPLDVKNSSGDRAAEQLSEQALETVKQKYERDFALFDYQSTGTTVAA
jgi:Sulfotransferase family